MSAHFESSPSNPISPDAYGPDYYLVDVEPGVLLYNRFCNYKPRRDIPRAQAMAEAVGLEQGQTVLDFGCGPGAMTAAFNAAGYPTIGVDTSPHAIDNAIPEAKDRVVHLGGKLSLSDLPNDMVDLVIAKDVFEHLPEDEIHRIVDDLTCIGRQVLAIIPTTDENGSFIFPPYNKDPTHVTRLTRELWLGRFRYDTAREIYDISERIDREDKTPGTLCMLLEETDRAFREMRMRHRVQVNKPFWRQVLGLPHTPFNTDFERLLSKRPKTI